MRKRLWSVGAVVGAGALLAVPVVAAAQDDGDDWLTDALAALVENGTLTDEQAAAVADALDGALDEVRRELDEHFHDPDRHHDHGHDPGRRPLPGHGHGHHPGPVGGWFLRDRLEEVAEVIGVELDGLAEALREGDTLAEIAEANGVDPQQVIDALVTEAQERLDRLVENGRLDEDEAAERLADATERITELVNEGFPFPRHHHADVAEGD